MSTPDCDVLIVGGGIQGVGVAQAAAAAGYRALVLEERGLAAATSGRSSKLIHGGLRYLESGELRLVRQSLAERELALLNAPELVRMIPFHIPLYRDTTRRPWQIRAGLSLYALLAGLGPSARFESLPTDAWPGLDGLCTAGLTHVFRYFDGQTDDRALTRAVMRSAVELGAELHSPARFLEAERVPRGWSVRYRQDGEERTLVAASLVNAAGPWVQEVRRSIHPAPPAPAIELVGGAHVELPGQLVRGIYYTEAPRDRRAVFVMPWKGRTLVGTTETPYRGDPASVEPLASEIEYLLETYRHHFPHGETEVLDAWAGLRVLPAGEGGPFRRSRDVRLVPDDPLAPRAVAIYGGKLTCYRATALQVLALLRRTLEPRVAMADTRYLTLTPDPPAEHGPTAPAPADRPNVAAHR